MPDPPEKPPATQDPRKPVKIHTHAELAAKTGEITAKLNANPELARAMAINPVAAIQEAGYELSPDIIQHVLETVQHSTSAGQRRRELEDRLQKVLGEPARVQDPAWLKHILFEKLKIQPLATGKAEPVYREAITGDALKRLQKFRPTLSRAHVNTPKPLHGVTIQVDLTHKSPLRFDLEAKLPQLEPAAYPPDQVDLNTLYFYKDSHPAARDLVELAIIQRSSYPIQTPDSYRKIRSGEKPNPLRTWIGTVKFGKS